MDCTEPFPPMHAPYMQFFTNHISEREGRIVSKVYVCPKCNNEAGIKVDGGDLM